MLSKTEVPSSKKIDAGSLAPVGNLLGVVAAIYMVFFWAFVWATVNLNTLDVKDALYERTYHHLVMCLAIPAVLGAMAAQKSLWWLIVSFTATATLACIVVRWIQF